MSGILKKIAADIAALVTLVKEHRGIITGAGMYYGGNWIFNNPLWMLVELRWGNPGIIGMIIAALAIDTTLLIYFRNRRTDFIFWNKLDELSKKESEFHKSYNEWGQKKTPWKFYLVVASYVPAKFTIFMLWFLKKFPRLGDVVVLLVLSILDNAFTTTMYLRHGYRNGLRLRDYLVYFISSIISIGYWTARNGVIVELIFRPILKLF
jgi:hypothetical protein